MENSVTIIVILVGTLWFGVLLSAVAIKPLMMIFGRHRKAERQLKKNGVEAEAIILHTEPVQENDHHLFKLKIQLQVRPSEGRSFVVEIKEAFIKNDANKLRTGNLVRVRYNPNNVRELYLVKAAS